MSKDIKKFQVMSKELGAIVAHLQDLCKLHEGHSALWEVAVRQGDGVAEGTHREKLHMLTDQILDVRVGSIQLQKKFEEGL